MSSIEQAIFQDVRKSQAPSASRFCPVVETSKQARNREGGPRGLSSGKSLWKLKQQQPGLFPKQNLPDSSRDTDIPTGFALSADHPGWIYNKEKRIYMRRGDMSGELFWLQEQADDAGSSKLNSTQFRMLPLHEGDTLTDEVYLHVGATAAPGTSSANSDSTAVAPKHVIIANVHSAADALKIDLGHLDQPAAMLSVFGPNGDEPGAPSPEAIARSLPEKLLRRLAGFRSFWSDDFLCKTIAETLKSCALVEKVSSPASVALILGRRITVAVIGGGRCVVSLMGAESAAPRPKMVLGGTSQSLLSPAVGSTTLAGDTEVGVSIALLTGASNFDGVQTASIVDKHLRIGRPRAANTALIKSLRQGGSQGAFSAASATLAPSKSGGMPAAKRQKISGRSDEKPDRIRVRQILMRHKNAKQPTNPLTRKLVTRTLEEAEVAMLDAIEEAEKNFPNVARKLSECQSALKGGDMAGDIGWLDRQTQTSQNAKSQTLGPAALGTGKIARDATKAATNLAAANKFSGPPGAAIKAQVPANVLKAALELEVGQLSDLINSELGVHLLQRTA